MNKLPDNFFWGGSVTSFQTEGAAYEDGKGLSMIYIKGKMENLNGIMGLIFIIVTKKILL